MMLGWLFGIDDRCGDSAKWSRGHLQDSLRFADRDRLGMLETIHSLQDEIDELLSEIDLLKAAQAITIS